MVPVTRIVPNLIIQPKARPVLVLRQGRPPRSSGSFLRPRTASAAAGNGAWRRTTTRPLTHRYQLLAQKPDVFAGGTMRTVSELEFPISTTITGAILIIEPGALRELHWHPNAAE